MSGIDSLNTQGLYFAQAQAAQNQLTKKALAEEKAGKTKKSRFASAFERAVAEKQFIDMGLPKELAEMAPEQAVIFLKDEADLAAEALKENQIPQNFINYREKVSQFMRYIVKTNFKIKTRQRPGLNKKGKPFDPQTQIIVINNELDKVAQWMLYDHKGTLQLLMKIDEIKGMLVDLLVS